MKKLIVLALLGALGCNDQAGRGGEDAMKENMNQNNSGGNDAAYPADSTDDIHLSDDTVRTNTAPNNTSTNNGN